MSSAGALRLVASELEVLEVFGATEIYCDGSKAIFDRDVVHILIYAERRNGETVERHEIARFCMSRERYDENLVRAFERRYPGGVRH